jgi:hypothetical protein
LKKIDMGHLYRNSGTVFNLWSNGYAPFFADYVHDSQNILIAVSCRLGDLEATEIALLDTGAPWSVIDTDTAEILGDQLGPPMRAPNLRSWRGDFRGNLHNLKITLIAQQGCGVDFSLDGTVFVADGWNGPIVLGFHGFLERVRIALDPGLTHGQELFFFGEIK